MEPSWLKYMKYDLSIFTYRPIPLTAFSLLCNSNSVSVILSAISARSLAETVFVMIMSDISSF